MKFIKWIKYILLYPSMLMARDMVDWESVRRVLEQSKSAELILLTDEEKERYKDALSLIQKGIEKQNVLSANEGMKAVNKLLKLNISRCTLYLKEMERLTNN